MINSFYNNNVIYIKFIVKYITTKLSLRRIQYRVVVYNEIGHNPREPANKKSLSMEEKIGFEHFRKSWN